MDWLRNIVSNLPLDDISEVASRVTIWWSHFVADVPPDMLPMYAYIGFSAIVLLLWLFVVKVLPSPIGGMSWMAIFAILFAPGSATGNSGEVAPASIGVLYSLLMKEPGMAMRNLLPILVVFSAGMMLGFIWQMIKSIIESNIEKTSDSPRIDEQQKLQLASGNYAQLTDEVDTELSNNKELSNNRKEEMLAKPADRPVQQPSTISSEQVANEQAANKPEDS
ncbi:hypothetical protein [Psychrobacter lutiphocae]|uniref:hypothetical protein n=1 Tax=Psychrobacter lutiphocae TaxID=540500 RepID=UPI00037F0EB0|nr:hypothetical protein [Psychrobacter lutiphocae]